LTSEVLRATAALAIARGATPLIVVPQFNREDDLERTLRRRVLDDAGLPYVFVEFDSGWRIPGDLHPNAATAHRIAIAIADRLLSSKKPALWLPASAGRPWLSAVYGSPHPSFRLQPEATSVSKAQRTRVARMMSRDTQH